MINALMSRALSSLNVQVVEESLCGTASAIVGFCNNVKRGSLRVSLESYGLVRSSRLNGWALPDAVWITICLKQPRLNCYPLGAIAERAVKKTIVILSLKNATHKAIEANPNLNEHKIQNNLRRYIKVLGIEGVLKLFLSQYFFELCIDQFRRSWDNLQFDTGFWYNFSKEGYFAPLKTEREMRQNLLNRCEEKAELFLPFLMRCLKEKDYARSRRAICGGFKVFGVTLPKGKSIQNLHKPFVNIIVGTKSLSELRKCYVVGKKAKRFLMHTEDSNVSFSFDALEHLLGHPVHSLIKDLLDIGAVVYMADLHAKREFNLGRRLGILMPVRNPRIWSGARMDLERAVSFLGRDDLSIKHKERMDGFREFSTKSDSKCVCLFSGGLDTLAGAAWAIENGFKPIFVSHYSSNLLAKIQKSLINQLEKIYNLQLQHMGIHVGRGGNGKNSLPAPFRSVMAQHLRSFLFLSLAAAVALESNIRKVYMFENGPVALNPLFSEARVNTRTTHPHFLAHFKNLIKVVFGIELKIENPFLYLTKGEVIDNLGKPELKGLVAKSISCWNWSRVPIWAKQKEIVGFKGRHCGECIPCIIRRTAMHHAHLWKNDADYLTGVFNQFPTLQRNTKTMVADLLRFCQNTKSLSDTELLLRAPDLSVYEGGIDSRKLVEMHKRHAQQVVNCFRARSNNEFREIFDYALK